MSDEVDEMATKMLAYIERVGGYCTYVELQCLFGDEARGSLGHTVPGYPNLVLWEGMSEAFDEALNQITPQLTRTSASPFSYFADGGMLNYPLAKSARQYKKPRWLPVCFSLSKKSDKPADVHAPDTL